MDKFFNCALTRATNQARRLFRDNTGKAAPGITFSLTGLGFAGLSCFMFLNASFNIQSSSFTTDLLKALPIF